MKTGALLFAFDGEIAYTKIAQECARRIKKYLDIPVTLVTDQTRTFSGFDNQILVDSPTKNTRRRWADGDTVTEWKNSGRSGAYDLTPYDRTLLLDVDYLVSNSSLKTVLETDGDFFAHNTRMYINENQPKTETFGSLKTKMWWATVCVFNKCEFAQDVFDIWKMIEQNYNHYSKIFNFRNKPFRNDFCLSMALLLANGNQSPDCCAIPWPLINIPDSCELDNNDSTWKISYNKLENNKIKNKHIFVKDQDIHVMCKFNLNKVLETCQSSI